MIIRMILTMSKKITNYFLENKVIDENDKDIYTYGSEILISETLCLSLIMGIGIILDCFIETIFYLIVFIQLRTCAGGYHASTHRVCIMASNIAYMCIIVCVRILLNFNLGDVLCLITIASIMIIFKLAPVGDPRKKLDQKEIFKYKKRTQCRVIFWGLFIFFNYYFFPSLKNEMLYGMMAVCEAAILLLIGLVNNNRSLINYIKY